jgi:hypothetical protein
LLYHREVRRLRPDLLIVAYDINDGATTYRAEETAVWREPEGALRKALASEPPDTPWKELEALTSMAWSVEDLRPYLYESGWFFTLAYSRRWLRDRLSGPSPHEPPPDRRPERRTSTDRCPSPHVIGAFARPWDARFLRFQHYTNAHDESARRDGVPVIFLSVPLTDQGDILSPVPYSTHVAALARAADRRHVDPAEAFCGHPVGRVMLDFCHPPDEGHAIIARMLERPAEELLRSRKGSPPSR